MFRFTWKAMLWDMTFSQLLTLVETRNSRELRQHEEAERRAKLAEQGYVEPPRGQVDQVANKSDIERVFGKVRRPTEAPAPE